MIATRADLLAGCRLVRGDRATPIESVAMDSRAATAGSLFVAIRGGVAFTDAARAAGAAAVLVPDERVPYESGVVLGAADTIAALQAIGAQNRLAAATCTVVGVTGSSGKTSTKDVLHALIAPQRPTIAAAEGHNNEIGLPFTLTRIGTETRVAICELSMRGPGQIDALAVLARPDVGVVTNVGEAHLELLGSRQAIAAAKGELLGHVSVAVLPDDEPLLAAHLPAGLEVLRFGETDGADVQVIDRLATPTGTRIRLLIRGETLTVDVPLRGAHHARNLAAGFAVALALELELRACVEAAGAITLQRWRSEPYPLPGGGVIVNDAYNANPSSLRAALEALAEYGEGRLVAVLGEMAELGDGAVQLHETSGAIARELGYEVIVGVGTLAGAYLDGAGATVEGQWFATRDGLVAELAAIVRPGDRVLVKGSRSAGLEAVAEGLARLLANGAEP